MPKQQNMPQPLLPETYQQQVIDRLTNHQQQIAAAFDQHYPLPELRYDIRGANAGMAVIQAWRIRLNPSMLLAQPEPYIEQVPGHEWAHLVTHRLFGKVRPHGKEWQHVMRTLGLAPRTTHAFTFTKARQERTVTYYCDCPPPDNQHQLGIRRHNNARKKGTQYLCRRCGATLRQKT